MRTTHQCVLALAFALIAGLAAADTIKLDTGVVFDGVVKEMPDGNYSINAGGHVLIYQKSEVTEIEKNARTGVLNMDEVKAEWAKRDKELTDLTGLNADQRGQVDELIAQLVGATDAKIMDVRGKFAALQQQFDVFRYLAYAYRDMSQLMSPIALDILFRLDPQRAIPTLRESAKHPYFEVRKKALECLGLVRDTDSVHLIAQGLADNSLDVRIMAAYSLANAGAKEATPALTASLKHPDMRVGNASREALEALWKTELADPKPRSVEEWTAFWSAHSSGLPNGIALEGLEPLIPPEREFQDE